YAFADPGGGRERCLGDRLRIGHDELCTRQISDRHHVGLVPVLQEGGGDGEVRFLQGRGVLWRTRRWNGFARSDQQGGPGGRSQARRGQAGGDRQRRARL